MEYRKFRAEDSPALRQMLSKLQNTFTELDEEYRNFDSTTAQNYLDDITNDTNKMNGEIFLAFKDGEAIGFIQGVIIEKNSTQYHPCREGWIGLLFVEEKYRSQNIGKTLMNKMCNFFHTKNCDYVKLFCSSQNTDAIDFYQKYGFIISNLELKFRLSEKENDYHKNPQTKSANNATRSTWKSF